MVQDKTELLSHKDIDVVPPLGGVTDHKDDEKSQGRQRVGVTSGRGGYGRRRVTPHCSINKEAAEDHSG